MIRDRLKRAAKKVALKVFNMEWDAEETATQTHDRSNNTFDPSVIPKLVDGSGDTPGATHKEDIGRTWVAAQISSGAPHFFLDIRPPGEVATGLLPGAVLLPGEQIKKSLHRLPPKDERVTVYDQTGELGSEALAAWLRGQGWGLARRLRGGYAEWIEHGETVIPPKAPPGAAWKVSDPVRLKDGRTGVVQEVLGEGAGARYTIWLRDGDPVGPVGADALGT